MADSCSTNCNMKKISNGPIRYVEALPNGVLSVFLETGGMMHISLQQYFDEARFRPLKDENVWNNVDTNERFVHWYKNGVEVVELGWDELINLAIGSRWA